MWKNIIFSQRTKINVMMLNVIKYCTVVIYSTIYIHILLQPISSPQMLQFRFKPCLFLSRHCAV